MKKALFEYSDYKLYLSDKIDGMPKHGRGERSKLAEALRCHLAYVSQVLKGEAQLSLEQADIINQYFDHSPDEADFFLLLVQAARAGTRLPVSARFAFLTGAISLQQSKNPGKLPCRGPFTTEPSRRWHGRKRSYRTTERVRSTKA